MLQVIKELLIKIIEDIDSGNCNLSDAQSLQVIETLKKFNNREKRLSKYAACEYLNISRATFDNYIKDGKIPEGKHEIGFKEKSWYKEDLDKFIKQYRGKQY